MHAHLTALIGYRLTGQTQAAKDHVAQYFTKENITDEIKYLDQVRAIDNKTMRTEENPYGFTWALLLARELEAYHDNTEFRRFADEIQPS